MIKKVLGYSVTFLLAGGVIATLLVVLMVPSISEPSGGGIVITPSPTEPSPSTETEPPKTTKPPTFEKVYAYAEVPGFGQLKGYIPETGAAIFTGIPYAESTDGDNRWRKPVPLSSLNYEGQFFDASTPRPACPQICDLPSPEYSCPTEMSEDCLHLAVYLPKKLLKEVEGEDGSYYQLIDNIQNSKIPVMVFIYGGAYIAGANSVTLYDGRFLAEKGEVIVVVPNYRVGPFGFFYQDSGDDDAALGNFGIWDQIEALRWVSNKIQNFGGDPEEITLFGQSAGAQSVAVHLVNNVSDPLFKRAILQSNPFGLNFKTTAEAQDTCNKFVESFPRLVRCDPNDMVCLRTLTTEEILDALENFPLRFQLNQDSLSQLFEPWAPIYDQELLTQHPYYTFLEGNNQDKPIVYGFSKEEGMFFILQALSEPSQRNILYETLIKAMFGEDNVTDVMDLYPPDCPERPPYRDCDNRYPMDDVVTDYMFTCPSRKVFNIPSRFQDEQLRVWWYTFDQVWSFPDFWENFTACYDLTCHGAELPYLFDLDTLSDYEFTAEESILAEKMIHYWSSFAKYGEPNPSTKNLRQARSVHAINRWNLKPETFLPSVEHWPRMYESVEGSVGAATDYQTLRISASGETVLYDFMKEKCDFWDKLDLYLEDDIKLGPRKRLSLQAALNLIK